MKSLQDARSRVQERVGVEALARIEALDRAVNRRLQDEPLAGPGPSTQFDYDLVVVGGGLSLLVAAAAAGEGLRVAVFERGRAGHVHREWNASEAELAALVQAGILTAVQLDALVVARYREGFCLFHGGEKRTVRGVLDRAIDAGPFLTQVRNVCNARGVAFFDGHTLRGLGADNHGVRAEFELAGSDGSVAQRVQVASKLLVDARGAASPYATADIVCPTVGGVLRGIRRGRGPTEIDADVGEILVTTEGIEAGVQHVWEAFPAHPGETTVYLFYYDGAAQPRGEAPLLMLYDRFFRTLPRYKSGDVSVARPTFGYIPGWSRTTAAPRGPHPRVLLSGDAAARHSPLTFCGFGAMLRSFQNAGAQLAKLAEATQVRHTCIMHDTNIHRFTGTLAKLMASRTLEGAQLNALLNVAFGVLDGMGNERYAALLQDRLPARDFYHYAMQTAKQFPAVYGQVFRGLGPINAVSWAMAVAADAALNR